MRHDDGGGQHRGEEHRRQKYGALWVRSDGGPEVEVLPEDSDEDPAVVDWGDQPPPVKDVRYVISAIDERDAKKAKLTADHQETLTE